MKVAILFTGSGPIAIITSYQALTDPELLTKLQIKGIGKFLAYEVPEALARERYGTHFTSVLTDLHESDDLRVLDYNGQRVFQLVRFSELGPLITHE